MWIRRSNATDESLLNSGFCILDYFLHYVSSIIAVDVGTHVLLNKN